MTVEILTFCDFAQDNGGKLTIVGSFDTVRGHALPIVLPLISLAAKLRFSLQERGRHRFEFSFTDLDGQGAFPPISGDFQMEDFTSSTAALALTMNIINAEFRKETTITVRLDLDGKEAFHTPLHVVRTGPPSPGGFAR